MKIITTITALVLTLNAYAVLPAPDGGYPNYNTAEGDSALFNLDTALAQYNTALGDHAMYWAVDCEADTAVGFNALQANTTGSFNSAFGDDALFKNTTGSFSTGLGFGALYNATTGSNNVAVGNFAGSNITTESNNIDIGHPGVAGDSGVTRIGLAGQQGTVYISGIVQTVIANNSRAVVVDQNGRMGIKPQQRMTEEEMMDKIEQLERHVAALTAKLNN